MNRCKDALRDFTVWNQKPPFRGGERNDLVMPARARTGLVAAKRGTLAHLDAGMAVVFEDGIARFGARFLCYGGSGNVVVLPDARAYGGICELCVDAASGPCVYHCRDVTGLLLYIGCAKRWLRRKDVHERQTPWWPDVADVQVTHYQTIFEAARIERQAIDAESPLYNKQRRVPYRLPAA